MIHKNRGNRRWMDKRKRRSKYNLCQRIWGDAMYFLDGILGKYDKGKIHDIDHAEKTNGKVAVKNGKDNVSRVGTLGRLGKNYSHSDKKKIESCNDKLKNYEDESEWEKADAIIGTDDSESYYECVAENSGEANDELWR